MSEVVKLSIVAGAEEQGMPDKKMTVGERLVQARVQQELTVDQVAGQLKWSTRQIAEIEAGNYSVFPDMLTVRGFVRTYAKILKIDSAPLLEELNVEIEKLPSKTIDRPKLDMPFPAGDMPWRHNSSPQKIIAVVFVILLCLLAAFVYRDALLNIERSIFPPKSEILTANVDVKSDVQEVVSTPNSNSAVGNSPATPVVSDQKNEPVAMQNSIATAEAAIRPGSEAVNQANAVAQSQKQPVVQGANADALVINFRQDSWLQIKRADGTVLSSHLYKAGSEESFAVTEPLNLVIGNAPGVDAKLRGQKLAFPQQIGSNVVNLSIK